MSFSPHDIRRIPFLTLLFMARSAHLPQCTYGGVVKKYLGHVAAETEGKMKNSLACQLLESTPTKSADIDICVYIYMYIHTLFGARLQLRHLV